MSTSLDSGTYSARDANLANSEFHKVNRGACLKIPRGSAARDFGRGQDGEFRASPKRAVRNEPTQATGKRPAARRVFGQKAVWLRCSSVKDPQGIFSFVAPRHPAFCPKTEPLGVFSQALSGAKYLDVNLRDTVFENIALTRSKIRNACLGDVSIEDANYTGMRIEGILVTELLRVYREIHPPESKKA